MVALKTKVTRNYMAEIAIGSLRPHDREDVERHIALLERFPDDPEVRRLTRKLEDVGLGDLYIIRASADFLILFRYLEDSSVEVMDIMSIEWLQWMHERTT